MKEAAANACKELHKMLSISQVQSGSWHKATNPKQKQTARKGDAVDKGFAKVINSCAVLNDFKLLVNVRMSVPCKTMP